MTNENIMPELPEELDCPEIWPFGPKWNENISETLGWKAVDAACGVYRAGSEIEDYLSYEGQRVFEKLIIQNKLIKDIKSGRKIPGKLTKYDVDWQMGNTWARHIDLTDKIFFAYGASRAPKEVLEAINYQKDLIDKGYNQSLKILGFIEYEAELIKTEEKNKLIEREREYGRIHEERMKKMDAVRSKWNQIDVDHSKIEIGFIYVLTNILMPGVYKIGFTGNNPDKRAEQISQQYNLPSPFVVLNYWRTRDPYIVEQRVHSLLREFKINGEFFNAKIENIESIILKNIQL